MTYAVMHVWNGDKDGHNCADCPDDSVWRCDKAAHFPADPMDLFTPEEKTEQYQELERLQRHRRLHGPDGRQLA